MTSYTVTCTSQGRSTQLTLSDGFVFGFPTWECNDGPAVWGNPYKGSCLSPKLTGGYVQLTTVTILNDWSTAPGSSGAGFRDDLSGGSFPSGDFEWSLGEET